MSRDTTGQQPTPVPGVPDTKAPDGQPGSGAGADTALQAMLRKRLLHHGSDPDSAASDSIPDATSKFRP